MRRQVGQNTRRALYGGKHRRVLLFYDRCIGTSSLIRGTCRNRWTVMPISTLGRPEKFVDDVRTVELGITERERATDQRAQT